MVIFLYVLFFLSCFTLVASVLLQPGKTDAGALFTSNISSTAFQPRGSQTILSKITIFAATVFMLSALLLAMPALTGNISVLETIGETQSETTLPAVDTNSNAAVDANANTSSNSETIVIGNTNELTNTNSASNVSTTANISSKIDEPKPPQADNSNR